MTGFALGKGIVGYADISDDGLYRHWLSRTRKLPGKKTRAADDYPYILWCGLNPSPTADADNDDRSTRIEQMNTWFLNYRKYVRVNCVSLIASSTVRLLASEHPYNTIGNIKAIRALARDELCEKIVVTFGTFPPELRLPVRKTLDALYSADKQVLCLGHNTNGTPSSPMSAKRNNGLSLWKRQLY